LRLELQTGSLVILAVPRWRLSRTIAAVTARDVPLTPPAARFLELLRARFVLPDELQGGHLGPSRRSTRRSASRATGS
jgi:hypothetical protein